MTVLNPHIPIYSQIVPSSHAVAAGAAGWIDLDVSADVSSVARFLDIRCKNSSANPGVVGARDSASALDTTWSAAAWEMIPAVVDIRQSKTIKVYRHAVDARSYIVMGYSW